MKEMKCWSELKGKVWQPVVAMMLFGVVLTGCTDSNDDSNDPGEEMVTGDDASDKMPFEVVSTVVNNNGIPAQTVALRYYSDMPNVAYIDVSDFQKMLAPYKSIRVSRTAASQYVLTTSKGETATVNTADEKMEFDDFMSFVSLFDVNSEGFVMDESDELYFVRVKPDIHTPAEAPVTFDLKKYGIDLRGDGQTVYVPLSTLSDIYSSADGNHVLFNGDKIMLAGFEVKPAEIDRAFFLKPYETAERPADLAAYSYGELCFAIDHFYGRPGRKAIDRVIETKGLDQALDETGRKLLKSTKMNEYVLGLEYLAARLNDGGHTHISPVTNSYAIGLTDRDGILQYMNYFVTAFEGQYPMEVFLATSNITADDGSEFAAKQRQNIYGSDYFTKIGNTIYCTYDDFGPYDSKAWTAFYKGGPMPTYNPDYEGDICGIIEALDTAVTFPEVKNFVLDLTCNNGGDASVLATITNLLAGKSKFRYENILTKQRGTSNYLIDGNFDRAFNEMDNAPRHPELNIAIMTSHYAFSSGNLLPSLMKDYGYLIIGEKSGGGSCSIQRMCTAEGFCYILSSSRFRLLNDAGENIDGGVEPHIALEVKQAVGMEGEEEVTYSDFSAFYDPSVGEQIVNWYANKK